MTKDSDKSDENPTESREREVPPTRDEASGSDRSGDELSPKDDEAGGYDGPFGNLLEGMTEFSAQAVKYAAKKTRETTFKVLKNSPEQMELLGRAGRSLRELREVAGVSLEELSSAVDLNDIDLLRSAEEGKAALPFEVLLRLSSYYARNDPIPFIMKYSRVYTPGIWRLLKTVGLEPVVMEAERELQFIQIYRGKDEARALSDEGFKEVLEFTRKAFEMSLHFVAVQEGKSVDDDTETDAS